MIENNDDEKGDDALPLPEQRLALALSAAKIGVWELDYATNRVEWSEECVPLLGSTVCVNESDEFRTLVNSADLARLDGAVEEALLNHEPYTWEFRFLHPFDGWRWLRTSGRGIYSAAGEPIRLVGTVEDITELRELEAELREAQKMEAIGELAAGIAHDFNNLLTIIATASDLCRRSLSSDSPLGEFLDEIQDAQRRGAALTRQLLAFARKSMIASTLIVPDEVVSSTERMLSRLIGDDVAVSMQLDGHGVQVMLGEDQLAQVLINLILNARDAMPQGGQIEITSRVTEEGSGGGAWYILRVADNGCGMTTEVQERIFHPFFTTKTRTGGTGMGLPVVYGIIQQAHGHIAVETELGRGTTFEIRLPLGAAEALSVVGESLVA